MKYLTRVKAFAVGGVDYIIKPFSEEEVFARLENNLTIRRLQKQLSEQNARLQQEIRDVASQRASQKLETAARRKKSEGKFRRLFENAPIGIFCSRVQDNLILEANQYLIQMLGYSCAADVINQKYITNFSCDLKAQQQILAKIEAKGEIRNA